MLTPELEVQAVGKRLMEDGEKERWRQKETKQGNGTGENHEEEGVRGVKMSVSILSVSPFKSFRRERKKLKAKQSRELDCTALQQTVYCNL